MRTRVLAVHADYRCRHAGACCSSGWEIPIEPTVEDSLRAALSSGRLRSPANPEVGESSSASTDRHFRPVSGLPHGARVLLHNDARGRCVFLEKDSGGLCAIHRQLGKGALPSACRDFPRVVTLSPLGASITLSHYCPTAAGLLFRLEPPASTSSPEGPSGADPLLAIETDPPAFPPERPYAGLDAREALPPLLRPDVLMDWPSLDRWERHAVSVLADDGCTPESAIDRLARMAEEARRWTPARGPFGAFFEGVLDRSRDEGEPVSIAGEHEPTRAPHGPKGAPLDAWRLVAQTVPHRDRLAPAPEGRDDADERWVAPTWASLGRPIRRWLAAKAFASWLALQGEGLRTCVAGLRLALAVLRAEAARECAACSRPLDRSGLREAIRRSDLLLVHLTDPLALARRLSRAEATEAATAPW